MTTRERFLAMIDERIRLASTSHTHGGYIALKSAFETLFPPNEIEFGPYNHGSENLEESVGMDRKKAESLESVKNFDSWVRDAIKGAMEEGKELPSFSQVAERIDSQQWPSILKMILMVNAIEYFKAISPRIAANRAMKEILTKMSEAKTNEEKLDVLESMRKQKMEKLNESDLEEGAKPEGN